jgi:hypothetical protein
VDPVTPTAQWNEMQFEEVYFLHASPFSLDVCDTFIVRYAIEKENFK